MGRLVLIDLDAYAVLGDFASEEEAQDACGAHEGKHELVAIERLDSRYTLAQLAKIYNSMVKEPERINRFSDKLTAKRRLLAVFDGTTPEPQAPETEEPQPTQEDSVKPKKKSKPKKPERKARTAAIPDGAVLKATAEGRKLLWHKGAPRGALFAIISRTDDGITLKALLGKVTYEPGVVRAAIGKMLARKAITVKA